MIRRLPYWVAAVALLAALIGLSFESRRVAHGFQMLPGQVPVAIWEPGPARGHHAASDFDRPIPVVILCHGFSGNIQMMSTLARRLAGAGYAVITPDFRGHGQNANPFAGTASAGGLLADIDAALLYARMQPHYDGQRIVLAGHSMGASAVLEHAQRDTGVAGVIAISGGRMPTGPYPPPNVLLIWGSGDPARIASRSRAVGARLTGQAQLVANRTYGDFERGTAVRVSEVDGADHLTILTAQEAADRIASWIAKSVGPGVSARPELSGSDPRASWALLGLLASVVLLWGLPEAIAPLGRRVVQTAPQRPLVWLVSLLAVLLFVSALIGATDARISGGILQFMPMLVVRELFAFLGLAGVLLLVIAGRYGRARAEGLGDYRTWIAGGLLFAFAYVAIGTLANSYNNLFPASHRLVWCALGTLILLPYFGVLEWVLRGPGRTGVWLPIVGKLLTLAALFGGALSGLLPGVVLLGVAPIALFFALFELVAYRLSRVSPNPWTAALFQAAFTSVAFGAIMPFTG